MDRRKSRTVWLVEYEKYLQTILKERFSNAKIYGDITEIDFSTVHKIDGLCGGFPCQDISDAGKKAGIEGSRSSLWKYYFKAIGILRPRFALIENISAIAGRGLNVVLADLASIGYDAEWHCVPASSVGAWHKRKRIFIIAYPNLYGQHTFGQDGRGVQGDKEQDIQAVSSERLQSPFESIQDGKLEYVSDTNKERLQRWQETRDFEESWKNGEQFTSRQGWWSAEPRLGRVVNGIPNRVDRIKSLGNAVVPQVAEVFAEAIKRNGGGL